LVLGPEVLQVRLSSQKAEVMSRLYELEYGTIEQHAFPCDGVDGEYVRVAWDPGTRRKDPVLWVESVMNLSNDTFWHRLRMAWRVLKRKDVFNAELYLNRDTMYAMGELFDRIRESKDDDGLRPGAEDQPG
jgi:hypothetical protein